MANASEAIDLCSSDDEEEELNQQGEGQTDTMNEQEPSESLDHQIENIQDSSDANGTGFTIDNKIDDPTVSRKRPAEIDLTGDEDECCGLPHPGNSSIHTVVAEIPQQKKFRGGGQGSSQSKKYDTYDERATTSSSRASTSASSTTTSPSSIRIVLEKDGRVKDTGILHEGMMDLLYQLNQTTIPIPAKLCTRYLSTVGVSNPYAKCSRQTPKLPSTVRWIQQQENWSCGYRSLQMVLTALLPCLPIHHSYFQMVPRRSDHVVIPSLGEIQSTLEQAWREGYDPQGARHYRQQILGKTGKAGELGAIEISTVMTYWGLDATVVQFVTCDASRRILPLFVKSYFSKSLGKEDCPYCGGRGSTDANTTERSSAGADGVVETLDSSAMASKILQFAEASLSIEETCDCPVLPLYLQWEGHAVTIVGYHEQNGCFLVFDPRKKVPKPMDGTQTKPSKHLWNTFQFDPEHMRNRDTQVIITSYRARSPAEKERKRDDMGVVTAAEDDVLRAIAASRSR